MVSNQLFSQIYDTKYETIVISDHGPVKLIYDMTKIIKGSCRWRLHPKWLHDTNFLEFVGTNIDEFFKINTNETSASVRWEAFKAYIRGQMISYTSSITNKVNLKLRALDEETYEDESHTMPQQKDLLLLRAQYNKLSLSDAENNLFRLKQTFYEQGEKSGELLTGKLKNCSQIKPLIAL